MQFWKFPPVKISIGTPFSGLVSFVGRKANVAYSLRRKCFSFKTTLRDDWSLTLIDLFTSLFFPAYEGKVDRRQHFGEQ